MSNHVKAHLLCDLQAAVLDYEAQVRICDEMSEAWSSGDAFAQAVNDPGLQYEAGNKADKLWCEVQKAAKAIAEYTP
jgi:hypothetical protein